MVMTVAIDKAGRIVVPKPLRERLDLHAGSQLELSELRDGIKLRLVSSKPSLVEIDGLLVHQGEYEGDQDLTTAVERQREERIRELMQR